MQSNIGLSIKYFVDKLSAINMSIKPIGLHQTHQIIIITIFDAR